MSKYIDLGKQLVRLYLLNLTCEDVIKEFLLSAETIDIPERKVGKWVLIGSRLESRPYACSKCNYAFQVDTVMGKTAWNYCPNCGARMGAEDGNS